MGNKYLYAKTANFNDAPLKECYFFQNVRIEFNEDLEHKYINKFLNWLHESELAEKITTAHFSIILLTNYYFKAKKIIFLDITDDLENIIKYLRDHIDIQSNINCMEINELNKFAKQFIKQAREAKNSQATSDQNENTNLNNPIDKPLNKFEKWELFQLGIKTIKKLGYKPDAALRRLFGPEIRKKYFELMNLYHPDKNQLTPESTEITKLINYYRDQIQ